MRKLVALYVENWKIPLYTFEAFWVVVALLEAAAGSGGADVVQFVYANF